MPVAVPLAVTMEDVTVAGSVDELNVTLNQTGVELAIRGWVEDATIVVVKVLAASARPTPPKAKIATTKIPKVNIVENRLKTSFVILLNGLFYDFYVYLYSRLFKGILKEGCG